MDVDTPELARLVDEVVAVDRAMAGLAAARFELIERARAMAVEPGPSQARSARAPVDLAHRAFRAELACALLVPERTAERLINEAFVLVHRLPATLAALAAGETTAAHARVIVDGTVGLTEAERADVEAEALDTASEVTPPQLERRVRTARERRSPHDHVQRVERARRDRYVQLSPEVDGMAWLSALLPAPQAVAIHARLDAAARAARHAADPRTLGQLKADLLCDALLGEGGSSLSGIRPSVVVTVPALTLLGRSGEAAELEGYGPIDPATARRLTAEAPTLQRLLTHPESGVALSLGRHRYRIPDELRRWLRLRDGGCRFPGCTRAVAACDLDHTVDWARDGETVHDNLAHLCRGHHTLKHHAGWRVQQGGSRAAAGAGAGGGLGADSVSHHGAGSAPSAGIPPGDTGVLRWTSPLGRTRITEPALSARPPTGGRSS